jgi:hypothetical protein
VTNRTVVWTTVALMTAAACSGGDASTEPVPTTATVPSGTPINDLEPGACLVEVPDASSGRAATVDCERTHRAEVYAVLEVDDGSFPGAGALSDEAGVRCTGRYGAYAGEPVDPTTDLAFAEIVPTEASWADGDRRVVCLALPPAGARAEGTIASVPAPTAT